MADLPQQPLDERALDALMLSTDQARAAYREQRLSCLVSRTVRDERKRAGLTPGELSVRAGMDPAHLSRIESGQGAGGATLAVLVLIAHALDRELEIQFAHPHQHLNP